MKYRVIERIGSSGTKWYSVQEKWLGLFWISHWFPESTSIEKAELEYRNAKKLTRVVLENDTKRIPAYSPNFAAKDGLYKSLAEEAENIRDAAKNVQHVTNPVNTNSSGVPSRRKHRKRNRWRKVLPPPAEGKISFKEARLAVKELNKGKEKS